MRRASPRAARPLALTIADRGYIFPTARSRWPELATRCETTTSSSFPATSATPSLSQPISADSWRCLPCQGGVGRASSVRDFAGARNGARCPTDLSRSPRSSISRNPLETVPHVVQRGPGSGLITRRSQVRILPPLFHGSTANRRVFGFSSFWDADRGVQNGPWGKSWGKVRFEQALPKARRGSVRPPKLPARQRNQEAAPCSVFGAGRWGVVAPAGPGAMRGPSARLVFPAHRAPNSVSP
jgi:hypothetical protein